MISQLHLLSSEDRNEPGERLERWNYTSNDTSEGLLNFVSKFVAEESLRVSVRSQDADVEERVMQRVMCLNKFVDKESKVRWKAAPGQLLG